MKLFLQNIILFLSVHAMASEPNVIGIWTCSKKDCKVEVYKVGNTYEAKLLWARKEVDEKGNPKLDVKNPDVSKRNLPISTNVMNTRNSYTYTHFIFIGNMVNTPKY